MIIMIIFQKSNEIDIYRYTISINNIEKKSRK